MQYYVKGNRTEEVHENGKGPIPEKFVLMKQKQVLAQLTGQVLQTSWLLAFYVLHEED